MISVVNGYVCTSPCEMASARQGKDPSAPPGTPAGASGKDDGSSALAGQPVLVLGGSLKDSVGTGAVNATAGTQPPRLDRIA